MEPIPIGEAARRLGLNASALRYYEERGLMPPAVRRGGRRMYGPQELRRLALLQLMRRLGLGLDDTAALLEGSGERWHEVLDERIAALDALIEDARRTREHLVHAAQCEAAHPLSECGHLAGLLDRRIAGETLESLADDPGCV